MATSLLFFTGGIFEVEVSDGNQFGIEGLRESGRSNLNQPTESLLDAVASDVYKFGDSTVLTDDACLIAAELSSNWRSFLFDRDCGGFHYRKTLSPSLRFIRFTEPVVIIDVTVPAAVRITTSDTTLSEMIFSIVPRERFRTLVLMVYRDSCLGLLGALACRSTTCDESFMSVTIKNRCDAEEVGLLPASTLSGPPNGD